MKAPPAILTTIGAIAVGLLSVFAALGYWNTTTDYNRRSPDPYRISFQDPRFSKAAAIIPEDAVVGYQSNLDFASLKGSTAFFGAQYAMTPRVLVDVNSKHPYEYVLANYDEVIDVDTIARQHGWKVEKDFGSGLAVFRKENGQ